MTDLQKQLFSMQDLGYREFHAGLMPGIDKDTIIGIRFPTLRKLAKQLAKQPDINDFLEDLPHTYYEENNLHGCIIELIKDYDTCINAIDKFLPYIDNWATCDLMRPKIFKTHTGELLDKIKEWIASDHTYTIRFGLEMLMTFYLDDKFKPEYLDMAAAIRSDEYYVNMMTAWFFATALTKQYEEAIPFIENQRMDTWAHNKTIQKAIESLCITPEQKIYLKTLKIKKSGLRSKPKP